MTLSAPKKFSLFTVSLLLFLSAYVYGVLTPSHRIMLGNDYYAGLLVSSLSAIAVFLGLYGIRSERIGFSTLTWLSFGLVILIQPVIHSIIYPDALVFPVGLLLLTALVSVFAVNLPPEKKPMIINGLAYLFLVTGILSVCTQLVHYFYPNHRLFFISPPQPKVIRIAGNISQPNIASFVNVLAMTSALYLSFLSQKNKQRLLWLLPITVFLMLGISLSISRAGIVLWAVAILGGLFYPWASQRVRFLLFAVVAVLSIVSYQLGVVMLEISQAQQLAGGVKRLMTEGMGYRDILLARAWWAFNTNPIFGIGYDNYLAFGLDNIERVRWFEPAFHAHNLIAQILAELGLLGLLTTAGVIIVLIKQIIVFFKRKLPADKLFLCLLLAIFVLYSMTEFPLWYPNFLLIFAFMIGLLDDGFLPKKALPKQLIMTVSFVIMLISTAYIIFYDKYLPNYETVLFARVDNQTKIDAYHSFPTILGFAKAKELMLHTVMDEDNNDPKKILPIGERIINSTADMTVTRIQVNLLAKEGKQDEVEKLNRRLCIWEYQRVQNCNFAIESATKIDNEYQTNYAKQLIDWYQQKYHNGS